MEIYKCYVCVYDACMYISDSERSVETNDRWKYMDMYVCVYHACMCISERSGLMIDENIWVFMYVYVYAYA